MMSRIDAHAMAKNTFSEDFSVQKCLTIIFKELVNILFFDKTVDYGKVFDKLNTLRFFYKP